MGVATTMHGAENPGEYHFHTCKPLSTGSDRQSLNYRGSHVGLDYFQTDRMYDIRAMYSAGLLSQGSMILIHVNGACRKPN